MGMATSVTALPVQAAIVDERHLAGTTAGVAAAAAAWIMDVLAWLALAAALIEPIRRSRGARRDVQCFSDNAKEAAVSCHTYPPTVSGSLTSARVTANVCS
jgi:hypothetical protein